MRIGRLTLLSRRWRYALAVAAVAVGVMSAGGSGVVASEHEDENSYLALGDSVVFGYITADGPAYVNPKNFTGYPDFVGQALRLQTVNASCPGEATGGFLFPPGNPGFNDNGCVTGFRARFPLHVSYNGAPTQMAFATRFLRTHHGTKLVTLGIGANDLFILQRSCSNSPNPACFPTGLPGTLATITANIDTILGNIRATGYRGVLEVVNYYSLDYSDANGTGLTSALNAAVTATASKHGAVVADAFTAFHSAATAVAGGHTCFAGLLNGNPTDATHTTCDVHPSLTGQQVLAQAVVTADRPTEND